MIKKENTYSCIEDIDVTLMFLKRDMENHPSRVQDLEYYRYLLEMERMWMKEGVA